MCEGGEGGWLKLLFGERFRGLLKGFLVIFVIVFFFFSRVLKQILVWCFCKVMKLCIAKKPRVQRRAISLLKKKPA